MPSDRIALETLLEAVQLSQSARQSERASAASDDRGDAIMSEALDSVRAMLSREDRGWDIFRGGVGQVEEGLSLDDLKQWSAKLRESTVGAPWIKHGLGLRSSYIWQGEMKYTGSAKTKKKGGSGRPPAIQGYISDANNQRAFFSPEARRRREGRLYYDGIALWIGEDATKKIEAVPLDQIVGTMSHPDYPGIIWAYKRAWSRRQRNGDMKDMVRWYFVHEYKSEQSATINKTEKVEQGWTAFDMQPNSFEGWGLGVPDALAAWIWAGIARDLYLDGVDVSSALATIAWKVTSSSKASQTSQAIQLGGTQGAGSTAMMGVGTDLSVMSSASKGYDFTGIKAVVSLVASALSISVIDLTSDPGAAGSSYGSAQTLEAPTRLAMMERRLEHVALDKRVLNWMGADDAEPYFEPLDDAADLYRKLQTVTLLWLQGAVSVDTYKALAAEILGIPDLGATPDGVMTPNNVNFIARPDVDADGQPTKTTPAPSQGTSTGTGDGANARDTRDDTIS